jgi:ecotin
MILRLILTALLISAGSAIAGPQGEHPELKAFPTAATGMTRFVITLTDKERGEDDSFKVELVAGKTLMTDGINQLRLGSSLEPKPVEGWGYTYYQVSGSDKVMSTLMAVPEGHQQVEQFVGGKPLIIRYNSRLPIVVYAPDGYEIRYRIWQAPATLINAGPQ